MPDYSKGKIYAIRVAGNDGVYIGSTTRGLGLRLCQHRAQYRFYKDGKGHFVSSFNLFELGEPTIELIENFACASKQQLSARENEIIQVTEGCINLRGSAPNPNYHKEWYQANKERLAEKAKENAAKKAEYGANYRSANADKRKEQQRAFYLANREKCLAYAKEQREKKKCLNY